MGRRSSQNPQEDFWDQKKWSSLLQIKMSTSSPPFDITYLIAKALPFWGRNSILLSHLDILRCADGPGSQLMWGSICQGAVNYLNFENK